MTEQEIIEGCIKEDPLCQKALFSRYSGVLMTTSRRYARHQAEAEDILQESFIKIFDHIGQFKNTGSLQAWMKKIVIRTALNTLRKGSFKNENIGIPPALEKSTEPAIYQQFDQEILLKLINELPTGYKIIFNLYAIEGYSHKEIAQELNIKPATSRSQLTKARKILQAKILSAKLDEQR